jgi:hypothetical protein
MAIKDKSKRNERYEWRRVTLNIVGKNLDPDKVSAVLGIQPDDWAGRGEPFGKNKKTKQGYWTLEGGPSTWRIETQMRNILKTITPVKHRLRRLIEEDEIVEQAYLTIAVMPPRGIAVAGYCFSAEVINEFTSLGIDIALSIHVVAEIDRMVMDYRKKH